MSFFAQNTRDLIFQFVKTEFKLKYNNSVLGFIWVLIKPLVIFLILYIVMSRVFPNGTVKFYPLYLLLGTIISGHFNEATMSGVNALLNKQNLILKVNFPRYVVVISSLLLPAVNFVINLVIYFFFAILFFQKIPGLFSLIYFLYAYFTLFLLMLAFALFTCIWNVRLRDISSIWELSLQLIFYLTPIFYTIDLIRQKSELIAFIIGTLNPVSVVLGDIRDAFIYNNISNIGITTIWFCIGALLSILGYFYFRKNVKKIAEEF